MVTSCYRRSYEVVVNKLTPGHEEDGQMRTDQRLMSGVVNAVADGSRAG